MFCGQVGGWLSKWTVRELAQSLTMLLRSAGRTWGFTWTYLVASGICSPGGATHGDLGQGAGPGPHDRPGGGISGAQEGRDVAAGGQGDRRQAGSDSDPGAQGGPGSL